MNTASIVACVVGLVFSVGIIVLAIWFERKNKRELDKASGGRADDIIAAERHKAGVTVGELDIKAANEAAMERWGKDRKR